MQPLLAKYGPPYFILWAQIFLAFVVCLVWAIFPQLGSGFFRRIETLASRLAERKTAAVGAVFLAAIAIRIALLPLIGVPFAMVQDEHCYLLTAEMFSKGRLAFLQPALWKSFETFHVNFYPAYASMYPPAQGAVLALGMILGNPWIGVLLSVGAMCAATVWMLQAWIPSRWALLGGVLAICNLGVVSYWINSYWGGAVAATGGALVLGALPRIFRSQRIWDGLLLGLGAAILANSRPYEGLILCVPAAGWFLWWLLVQARISPSRIAAFKAAAATGAVICAAGLFMSYYNWRLTGHPLLMPHSWNFRIYYRTPLFLLERSRPPIHYNNPQYESFYNGWVRDVYKGTWRDVVHLSAEKLKNLMSAFLWPGALPALFCVPLALPDRRTRFLFVEFFLTLAGIFLVTYSLPHYAAPLTCVFYGLLVQGIRHLRTIRLGARSVGIGLARASIVLLLMSTGYNAYHVVRTSKEAYPGWWNIGVVHGNGPLAVEKELESIPGKHLIVVRYSPTHNPHGEWVFNHADIDGSRFVWARELDQEQNEKLFTYFKDRHIWLFEPDRDVRKLTPLHFK